MLNLNDLRSSGQARLAELGIKIAERELVNQSAERLYQEALSLRQLLLAAESWESLDLDTLSTLSSCLALTIGSPLPVVPTLDFREVTIIEAPPTSSDPTIPASPNNYEAEVKPEEGEKGVQVSKTEEGNKDIYKIGYIPYSPPILELAVLSEKIYEIGEQVDIQVQVTSERGRDPIVARNIITPEDLELINTSFENTEVLIDAGVTEDTVYQASLYDETTLLTAQDEIKFYYPYLYGASSEFSFNPYSFNKKITPYSDQQIELSGTDSWFFFAYDKSLGELSAILSENGNDVTQGFTKYEQQVSSQGLDINWTRDMYVYKTNFITDLNDIYTFRWKE